MQRDNLPKHFPREHYNKNGKSKRSFETEEEAIRVISKYKLKDSYKPYKCKWCNNYHIGRIAK